jgi:hypothetical protein
LENAISSILLIGLLIVGVVTVTSASMDAVDSLTSSWKSLDELENGVRNTSITISSLNASSGGGELDLYLRNTGQQVLADYAKWDVIIHYSTGYTQWIPYSSATPGWLISNITIYENDGAEVVDPGLLNPEEVALMIIRLDPAAPRNADQWVKVAVENGVTAQAAFSWK